MLQERQAAGESSELIDQIFKILYATGDGAPAAEGEGEQLPQEA